METPRLSVQPYERWENSSVMQSMNMHGTHYCFMPFEMFKEYNIRHVKNRCLTDGEVYLACLAIFSIEHKIKASIIMGDRGDMPAHRS